MTSAAKLYERAALCHEKAAKSATEAEEKGWFELACIWLRLADSVTARIEFEPAKQPLELAANQIISPTSAKRIVTIGRATGPDVPRANWSLASARSSP
jgi:hypothetical protein